MDNLYRNMLKLAVPGIFALVNEQNKSVFVSYSRNITNALSRNINLGLYKTCEFVVLETENITNVHVSVRKWITHYRNIGYTICNVRIPAQYKIRVEINKDYKVEVQLVNSRYKVLSVQVFDTMEEAQNYVRKYLYMYVDTDRYTGVQ